jgi:hypothetical protein
MVFVALTLIWALPVKAEVITLSCDGTMKAKEQAQPHAITKMGLVVSRPLRISNPLSESRFLAALLT